MIIAIKIRLCHLLRGTTLTTNFGGKSIQVKPSVMHEACKRNVCWNRPLFCWERMSKWHTVVGVLSLLKNVKMAELNEEQGDEWPGSPSFLMRALCYWFIAHLCSQGSKKKTDIHCGMSLKVIGSWFVRISVLFGLGLVVVYCLNFSYWLSLFAYIRNYLTCGHSPWHFHFHCNYELWGSNRSCKSRSWLCLK